MNATLPPLHFSPALPSTPSASSAQSFAQASTKPLWAAVGVLSICVLSMGATLVHVNKRPEPLALASIPVTSAYAMNAANATPGTLVTEKLIEKPTVAGVKPAQSAPKVVAKQFTPAAVNRPSTQRSGAPAVIAQASNRSSPAPAPAPVCKTCGTIEAVTPITKDGQGSGVGVVAGGVLGGVVGNQIGKGTGRTAATVLGAVGGGWAGNAIEKNMKKTTAYSVRVRMADGSTRTMEQSSAPMVGSKVTVDGSTMRPA